MWTTPDGGVALFMEFKNDWFSKNRYTKFLGFFSFWVVGQKYMQSDFFLESNKPLVRKIRCTRGFAFFFYAKKGVKIFKTKVHECFRWKLIWNYFHSGLRSLTPWMFLDLLSRILFWLPYSVELLKPRNNIQYRVSHFYNSLPYLICSIFQPLFFRLWISWTEHSIQWLRAFHFYLFPHCLLWTAHLHSMIEYSSFWFVPHWISCTAHPHSMIENHHFYLFPHRILWKAHHSMVRCLSFFCTESMN